MDNNIISQDDHNVQTSKTKNITNVKKYKNKLPGDSLDEGRSKYPGDDGSEDYGYLSEFDERDPHSVTIHRRKIKDKLEAELR